MPDYHFSAIILAAGYASRMGKLKPLLPLGDKTAIERVVSLFERGGPKDIVVVTGHRGERIANVLSQSKARIVHNRFYDRGMFSSVQTGVKSLRDNTDAFFLIPADIPLVRPSTVKLLISAFHRVPGNILYPCFLKRGGHPPLIPRKLIPEILADSGDGGLRKILRRYESISTVVDVPDRYIHLDMDRPAHYEAAYALLDNLDIPDPEECEVILADVHPVDRRIVEHGRGVAALADRIARALMEAGCGLNLKLIHAAAMLHDICKKPENMSKSPDDHAGKGAALLKNLGFYRVAEIVGVHMDLSDEDVENGRESGGVKRKISENEIVYLADKCIVGTRFVPLEKRLRQDLIRAGGDEEVKTRIRKKWRTAMEIRFRVEKLSGSEIGKLKHRVSVGKIP